MTIIIGITGLARSGKDTAAEYLASSYGFKVFTMSDVIKTELMRRGMIISKENMSKLGDIMREEYGRNVVAIKTLEKSSNFAKVAITGMRSPEEIKYFRYEADKFYLLAIEANDDKRFERRSKEDPQRRSEFYVRDERDIKNKGLDKVIDKANCVIKNNYSKKYFYNKIDEFLKAFVVKDMKI